MTKNILHALCIFSKEEITQICNAIHHHSDKGSSHAPFDEILIDADVLQHCLHNPLQNVMNHEQLRYEKLQLELGLCNTNA